MTCFLGVDIGTYQTKGVLVDESGRIMEILSGWSERTERKLDRLAQPAEGH